MIRQKVLKTFLDYDPETGIFTRKIRAGRFPVGSISGSKTSAGYIEIRVAGYRDLGHRLAWVYVHGDVLANDLLIDHKDTIKHHNWIDNLRVATKSQNGFNMNKNHGISIYKGVYFDSKNQQWRGQLTVNGKHHKTQRVDSEEEAFEKISELRRIHHKEFANFGTPLIKLPKKARK